MGKQIFDRIKKIPAVLLVVLSVGLLTAVVAGADSTSDYMAQVQYYNDQWQQAHDISYSTAYNAVTAPSNTNFHRLPVDSPQEENGEINDALNAANGDYSKIKQFAITDGKEDGKVEGWNAGLDYLGKP